MEESTNHFIEFESLDDFSNLDTDNLLLEIWLKPTLVFKYLFKTNPKKFVWPLMIVASMTNSLETGLEKAPSFDLYGIGFLIGYALFGGLLGWISFYIIAWFFHLSGTLLNGKATSESFRTVSAWASIPGIFSIVFSIITVLFYGNTESISQIDYFIILVLAIIQMGLGIWSLVIMVSGTMYIQNFGIGKAILNLAIPFLTLISLILIIYLLAS